MVQFMKGDPEYGEVRAAGLLPGFEVVQKGLPAFVNRDKPGSDDLRLAKEGLELARQALAGGEWDLVILDEINVAVDYGLLTVAEVINALDGRRPGVDVVLTGRGAHPELVKRADMVSEILEIKHHFHQGVQARKGIEY
jgi:cob(I)alamin adenosyltransferase